jgi:peptidoglycan hydrolase-like protein with peptidoglycan-binding domain
MRTSPNPLRIAAASLVAALPLLMALPAAAQTQHDHSKPAAAAPSGVPATTITAVQQALKDQGIAVPVDGVLGDDTRAALRSYQTQHHLPVTGEPDAATLGKLGVKTGTAAAAPKSMPTMMGMAHAAPTQGSAAQSGTTQGGVAELGTAVCDIVQGQLQNMTQQMAQVLQQMAQRLQSMEQRLRNLAPKQN